MKKYIDQKEFIDFKDNQDKLIEILNHNMTTIQADVEWLKKINMWQLGFIATMTIAVVIKLFI